MSMDVDRPMSPAAFRSMRRTSRPHPTVPVGQEMSDVKRCQEMSRDVKRCQEMSRVCFRDVNSKAGELSVVPVDHVISCHDHVQFDWHRYHRSHWQDLSSRVEPSRAPSHQA